MGFRLKLRLQNEVVYARLLPQEDRQEIKQRREFYNSRGQSLDEIGPGANPGDGADTSQP